MKNSAQTARRRFKLMETAGIVYEFIQRIGLRRVIAAMPPKTSSSVSGR